MKLRAAIADRLRIRNGRSFPLASRRTSLTMALPDNRRQYPPVGQCIYCGNTHGPLTMEHIIPFALGGKLKLPKSSCYACAALTKRFEQACLRSMLGPMRIRLNAPTRHPKERPDELPIYIRYADGTVKSVKVPAIKYPTAFALPIFPPPGILSGLPPRTTWKPKLWYRINHEEGRRIVQQLGGTGFAVGPVKTVAFGQMLAKIAHSFAVAQMGLNKFNPLLLDLILGRPAGVTHVVGGDVLGGVLDLPPAERSLHHLDLQREYPANGRMYVLANIRLFAVLDAPQYHVVVGELP